MQMRVIELKERRNIDFKIRVFWLLKPKHMVNRSIYRHHITVNLFNNGHVRHKTDFDIPLFDYIGTSLHKM